jgi:hypothetical protein
MPTAMIAFGDLLRFPCRPNKIPLRKAWNATATRASADAWPLVGVPTGAANGFDVLDIDPEAVGWFDQNFDALPTTEAHSTPRGLHLLFRHAPDLRSRAGIAPGVDVRADGGYCIWWPREGHPIERHPLTEWPDWLLELARGKSKSFAWVDPNKKKEERTRGEGDRAEVANLTEALRRVDPREWRDYERWLGLMTACRFEGIDRETFIEWSTQDEVYANHGELIARLWEGTKPAHSGALWAAFKEAGIKVRASPHQHAPRHSSLIRVRSVIPSPPAIPKPYEVPRTLNFYARLESVRGPLRRAKGAGREQALFDCGCVLAEMTHEGRLKIAVARDLLWTGGLTAFPFYRKIDCRHNI